MIHSRIPDDWTTTMTKTFSALWRNHGDALLSGFFSFATTAVVLLAGHHFLA